MAVHVPMRWLQEYVEVTLPPEELAELLTIAGLEVEKVEHIGTHWDEKTFVVGEVLEVSPHPNADRLSVVTVASGTESIRLVSGAPNLRALEGKTIETPIKVPLAFPGAQFLDAYSEERKMIRLEPSTIRGVHSAAMLCSEKELGMSDNHDGVLILEPTAPTGIPLRQYLGDTILHFDIKGKFSHLLSILGIAREVASLTKVPMKWDIVDQLSTQLPSGVAESNFCRLQIVDSDLCSRYSALLIRGVTVQPSPFWMQQSLLRAGMRPINNIVDITNYVMLEMGQPLHAFDYKLLQKRADEKMPTITVRRAKEKETMRTLDDVERTFDSEMLLITDAQGPIAIAGVMGGRETEVHEGTTEILLEAANFEFLNNRRTSQDLKLQSEASERFGKQIDPELTLIAAVRAAQLMVKYGGGVLETQAADLYVHHKEKIIIELSLKYVHRILGISISLEEITDILQSLRFEVLPKGDLLQVSVPSQRMDIHIPADLVEEIARVYGYNHIPPTLLKDEIPIQQGNPRWDMLEHFRDLLVRIGLDEIITYSISNLTDASKALHDTELSENDFIPLQNPLSQEKGFLRRSLLPGAFLTAQHNLRTTKQIAIFELGSVFEPQPNQLLPQEPKKLSILLSGPRNSSSWLSENSQDHFDFFDLKGRIETFLQAIHLAEVKWQKAMHPSFHPGRCAELSLKGKSLGFVGEAHPQVVQSFELPNQIFCIAELNAELLMETQIKNFSMHPISSYTPIYEDLAFVVDQKIPASRIQSFILGIGKPLLQEIHLFDVYSGENIGEHKKSLTFSMTYQSFERTLSDDDVAPIREKIIQCLKDEMNVTLRQ